LTRFSYLYLTILLGTGFKSYTGPYQFEREEVYIYIHIYIYIYIHIYIYRYIYAWRIHIIVIIIITAIIIYSLFLSHSKTPLYKGSIDAFIQIIDIYTHDVHCCVLILCIYIHLYIYMYVYINMYLYIYITIIIVIIIINIIISHSKLLYKGSIDAFIRYLILSNLNMSICKLFLLSYYPYYDYKRNHRHDAHSKILLYKGSIDAFI
jgi:hypothetical protein